MSRRNTPLCARHSGKTMINVYYFSGSGHCQRIADYCAGRLDAQAIPLEKADKQAERMLLVFPVYCQNIPGPVVQFLKDTNSKYAALLAAYGGISYGNVLQEAQKIFSGTVVAAAYFPTGHSYRKDESMGDLNKLLPLLEKQESTAGIEIPKASKNIFADFAPALRSRISVRLIHSANCNGCNVCAAQCPMGAIKNGKPDHRCIRCLRCVRSCPNGALSFHIRPVLKRYLHRRPKNDIKLYL